jgi:hypothetical protein
MRPKIYLKNIDKKYFLINNRKRRTIMIKRNVYILKLFPLFGFLVGCHSLEKTIQLWTKLEYYYNYVTSILFETEPGCTKTNFKFTEDYYKLNTHINNCFTVDNFVEYENTIKKYFEIDFFKNITPDYFSKNVLIVVVLSTDDGEYFKNGKFKKTNDNKFTWVCT